MTKRPLHFLTVSIGALGVVVCVAAAGVVWATGSRLSQANDRVFDRIDTALTSSRTRVLDAQKRVQESKITAQDVRVGVESWARREAKERIASRPEVENTAERLARGLRQADLWLEVSGGTLQTVQQTLALASSLGAPADAAVVDPLLDRLGGLRSQLKQSIETADVIREHLARIAEGETREERLSRFAQLALRVVATLSDIDSRLGQFAEVIIDTQANGQQLKTRTHRYIVAAQLSAVLLITWMAIGQVFICRYGWTRLRG